MGILNMETQDNSGNIGYMMDLNINRPPASELHERQPRNLISELSKDVVQGLIDSAIGDLIAEALMWIVVILGILLAVYCFFLRSSSGDSDGTKYEILLDK